jgi:alpha-L-rhamnosidase
VPAFLYELYGDTETMRKHYDRMVMFVDYIRREQAGTGPDAHIVNAALSDWAAPDQTSGRIAGTWGYHTMISKMARMAELTGHTTDVQTYTQLAADIKTAFNNAFFNETLGRYTATGNAGTAGATQVAQALALDAGLVPDSKRTQVLDALVELIQAYHPNGDGPHFSGGTIGMAPIIRALSDGGRDDVLWDLLQENDQPSYGFFMESTPAHPGGMTTIGEHWTRSDSKNHMILAQIEEWFHTGLAGIRTADVAYGKLIIRPKPVGDLRNAQGSYSTPHGTARSGWTKSGDRLEIKITIPANTTAEVWVPAKDAAAVQAPSRATLQRVDGGHAVYTVPAGDFVFVSKGTS